MRRVAIVGAGISGLAAAWQMTRESGAPVAVTLFEATARVGGIVETVRLPSREADGEEFVLELGPDGWVTEKPAALELVRDLGFDLGLEGAVVASKDALRRTYLLAGGAGSPRLVEMPRELRMMVPRGRAGLESVDRSPLFSAEARAAMHAEVRRAEELRRNAPREDESIASFTERHFGREVLETLAAPLLSGVFGGDVDRLSVRAVMAPFVEMERQHGSLIAALEEREAERRSATQAAGRGASALFTSLRRGMGELPAALAAGLPAGVLRTGTTVHAIDRVERAGVAGWRLRTAPTGAGSRAQGGEFAATEFDEVVLAASAQATAGLLRGIDAGAAEFLPSEASSAILVVFAWEKSEAAAMRVPPGFGFLVPPPPPGRPGLSPLLACTFADQKFPGRAPEGARVLRAFFGGEAARELLEGGASDAELTAMAFEELCRLLGPMPRAAMERVRRWPRSLPLYAVGHLERMAELAGRMELLPGLHLLGNGLHGVGLPDLIGQARALARGLTGRS